MDIIGYTLIVNMKELYSTLFQKNFNWYKNSMLQQAKYGVETWSFLISRRSFTTLSATHLEILPENCQLARLDTLLLIIIFLLWKVEFSKLLENETHKKLNYTYLCFRIPSSVFYNSFSFRQKFYGCNWNCKKRIVAIIVGSLNVLYIYVSFKEH